MRPNICSKLSPIVIVFLLIIDYSSSQTLFCWTGVESLRYESACSAVNTNYCVKFSASDVMARSCDTNGQWCLALGNGCRDGYNYFGAIGTICCCNTNNCNSADSMMKTTKKTMLLTFGIMLLTIVCAMFVI